MIIITIAYFFRRINQQQPTAQKKSVKLPKKKQKFRKNHFFCFVTIPFVSMFDCDRRRVESVTKRIRCAVSWKAETAQREKKLSDCEIYWGRYGN